MDESRISRASYGSRISRDSRGSSRAHPALHQRTPSPGEIPFHLHTPKPQKRTASPEQRATPRSVKSPLLPKESRPPPVIFDASAGGNLCKVWA